MDRNLDSRYNSQNILLNSRSVIHMIYTTAPEEEKEALVSKVGQSRLKLDQCMKVGLCQAERGTLQRPDKHTVGITVILY